MAASSPSRRPVATATTASPAPRSRRCSRPWPPSPARTRSVPLRQDTHAVALRYARSCYHHLAGRLDVAVTARLLRHQVLVASDGVEDTRRRHGERYAAPVPHHPQVLGPTAQPVLAALGVDLDSLVRNRPGSRPPLRFCVDWTEQRHHLAGALGAALLSALGDKQWIVRHPHRRALTLTDSGQPPSITTLASSSGILVTPPSERVGCPGRRRSTFGPGAPPSARALHFWDICPLLGTQPRPAWFLYQK
jgi:hypothetical protein